MEAQMKVDGGVIRALREKKSWSQVHLANASGLSVRTVQRVEMEGAASAETRLALAAALGVPVVEIVCEAPSSTSATVEDYRFPLWGWCGWAVGAIGSVAVVTYGYVQGAFPLDQVLPNLLPWIALLGIFAGALATWVNRRRKNPQP